MLCNICNRPANHRLPFNCTLCAREALYDTRVHLAHILLQREVREHNVDRHLGEPQQGATGQIGSVSLGAKKVNPLWITETAGVERTASSERTQVIHSQAEALLETLKSIKIEIAKKKSQLSRRRSELAAAKQDLSRRKAIDYSTVEKAIGRTQQRWNVMHTRTADSRIFLSREAAKLYGLHQRKQTKDGLIAESYHVGIFPIHDLRDLHNASSAHLTSATSTLAHLVHLVSHYFGLRLPAQIVLPHQDYPLPMIYSPSSSYLGRDFPFPGSTPSHSLSNSPSASRASDTRSTPRPRPLHLSKKLSTLVKEDAVAYSLFVEGITLLAWDIAWLCRTQGLDVGAKSWDEVCAMGRNLWQLLVAPPPAISNDIPSGRYQANTAKTSGGPSSGQAPKDLALPASMLGRYSHNTAHSSLTAAEGTDFMRGWRLQSPLRVVEKVKAMLVSERTGAEWEVLEDKEWEIGSHQSDKMGELATLMEETVLVKGLEQGNTELTGAVESEDKEEKGRSTSGWTKLKSRSGI
ncbi:MAG: hypothetical protein LQ342_002557 [Letrouitia transgressa]|nr:MAG: hypothetical protein LQ342_002557 [Letrouitia transgressa]